MLHFIYAIRDKKTEEIGYIGVTSNPNTRMQQHIEDKEGSDKKYTWLQQIDPDMVILETIHDRKQALLREKYWIQHYQSQGILLTNIQGLMAERKYTHGVRAMKCLNVKCENELPDGVRSTRKFCSGACRQEYFRQQHQADQDAALLAELEALRVKVSDQAQEITQLRSRLDVERRYLSDIKPRYFKSWLKKQPASPFVARMFADPLFPARGPRSLYEAHVRRLQATPEEHDDFVRLWKLMLLQS